MSPNRVSGAPDKPSQICRYLGVVTVFCASVTGGCASSSGSGGSGGGGLLEKVLDLAGLQTKPPPTPQLSADGLPSSPKAPQKVTLRIHAGNVLNTDGSGRSLSLVAKVYKLKEVDPFLQAPYDAFKEAPGAKPLAAEGVLEVREIVLTPGQQYEVVESIPVGATHLAVVGLFRAPDEKRWRFVFDAKTVAKSGITMGAHGCAWSVSEGQPVQAAPEALRLAGVRCR